MGMLSSPSALLTSRVEGDGLDLRGSKVASVRLPGALRTPRKNTLTTISPAPALGKGTSSRRMVWSSWTMYDLCVWVMVSV